MLDSLGDIARRCPTCLIPIEKESGCNFMTCRSVQCNGKSYFCFICGEVLKSGDHFKHFPKGPYEGVCNVRPGPV